jgi:hypothetical protein
MVISHGYFGFWMLFKQMPCAGCTTFGRDHDHGHERSQRTASRKPRTPDGEPGKLFLVI